LSLGRIADKEKGRVPGGAAFVVVNGREAYSMSSFSRPTLKKPCV